MISFFFPRKTTTFADEICLDVFFIPIFSIVPFVFLIPAVSFKTMGTLPRLIVSCRTSLVVPGMLLVIALSSFKRRLKRVDFPAFVGPAIITLAPTVKRFVFLKPPSAELSFFSK